MVSLSQVGCGGTGTPPQSPSSIAIPAAASSRSLSSLIPSSLLLESLVPASHSPRFPVPIPFLAAEFRLGLSFFGAVRGWV